MHPGSQKLYYKIGEVCRIVGVEAHVLRFWESEFPILAPPKNKSGQRIYRPKDIELLLRIKALLYEDGFTIAGARKQLGVERLARNAESRTEKQSPAGAPQPESDQIERVRKELENILTLLDRG